MRGSHSVVVLLLLATATAHADYRGRVVRVVDGDTVEVLRDGRAEKVRLDGVDCPESRQPFGTRAKQATSDLAFGRQVLVREKGRDRYGRTIGEVLVEGRSVNRELVRAGMAWWYRNYSDDAALAALEREARAARRGLWVDPTPVPPWEWRGVRRAR